MWAAVGAHTKCEQSRVSNKIYHLSYIEKIELLSYFRPWIRRHNRSLMKRRHATFRRGFTFRRGKRRRGMIAVRTVNAGEKWRPWVDCRSSSESTMVRTLHVEGWAEIICSRTAMLSICMSLRSVSERSHYLLTTNLTCCSNTLMSYIKHCL